MGILQTIRNWKNSALIAGGLTAGTATLSGCGDPTPQEANPVQNELGEVLQERDYLVKVLEKHTETHTTDALRSRSYSKNYALMDFVNEGKIIRVYVNNSSFDFILEGKSYNITFETNPFKSTIVDGYAVDPLITRIAEVKEKTCEEAGDSLIRANTKLSQQNDSLKAVITKLQNEKLPGF